ncbi:MAG: hypothetical protein HYY46_02825 [Deltaproteobacteria bacterium]|nr:hypothetical protein [Deltaproteobacteria bacterium]
MRELLCTAPEQKKQLAGTGAFSSIIGPTGEYLAGPDSGGEKILYAEVDPEVVLSEKISHDLTGHYNRFDLFQLVIDDRAVCRRPLFKSRDKVATENGFLPEDDSLPSPADATER